MIDNVSPRKPITIEYYHIQTTIDVLRWRTRPLSSIDRTRVLEAKFHCIGTVQSRHWSIWKSDVLVAVLWYETSAGDALVNQESSQDSLTTKSQIWYSIMTGIVTRCLFRLGRGVGVTRIDATHQRPERALPEQQMKGFSRINSKKVSTLTIPSVEILRQSWCPRYVCVGA